MARYLVTGGAGFIGSHIAAELLARGDQVRILDNFSTGRRENLHAVQGAEVVEGDVRSYHVVREAVDGCECVLHQAALPSVPRSVKDPITSNEVNVVGTLNVLNAARDARVRRLVYASSSSIYGQNPELPKREGMMPQPISPYAVSKLAAEYYVRTIGTLWGIETVALRVFNAYGPQQPLPAAHAPVIPRFLRQALSGGSLITFGNGRQTRDYVYVDDVVEALAAAATVKTVDRQVINVGSGVETSVSDLAALVSKVTGRPVEPILNSNETGGVSRMRADLTLAKRKLNFRPRIGLAEGLRLVMERDPRFSQARA